MAYSDSTHFSDKLSYKIIFISSYQSKDMIFAKLTHLQEFSETDKMRAVSHQTDSSPGR
jgi:hypothetical protein